MFTVPFFAARFSLLPGIQIAFAALYSRPEC
jgi:hypothetical protein